MWIFEPKTEIFQDASFHSAYPLSLPKPPSAARRRRSVKDEAGLASSQVEKEH